MNRLENIGVNKWLLLSALLLMCFGIAIVYTASVAYAQIHGASSEHYLGAHLWKVIVGLLAMFVISKLDYSIWMKFARLIFIVGAILTIATIVAGDETKGATRWIWGIQPSEILKFGLISWVCLKLSQAGTEIKSLKCSIIQPGIPLAIAALLLALQPNYSMLILFSSIVLIVLFVAGARVKYLGIALAACVPILSIALVLKKHTFLRIVSFLFPNENSQSSYQLSHSIAALGNGGVTGTGFGQGIQKLGYLPEAHKDVIYAVIGEEFGFLGTLSVLILFGILFYQGFEIAKNSSTRFGKYMAIAFTTSLFLNFFIHVCVSTGLFPTTGQPLPFLSYGGSNLIFSSIFVGILLNISKPTSGKKIWEPFVNSADNRVKQNYSEFNNSRSGQ